MSVALGRVRLLAPDADVALDGEAALGPVSAATHAAFDEEVRRLIDDAFAQATDVLERRRSHLDGPVRQLLVDETLEGAELLARLRRRRRSPSTWPPPLPAGPPRPVGDVSRQSGPGTGFP